MDVAAVGKLMHAPPVRLRSPFLAGKTAKNAEPHKATKRRGKETKLQQNVKPKQYAKGEDIPLEKANAELQTRNPRHIDIGGEGKYPNALNFTPGDAPNRVSGRAQNTLKNINSSSVDLITIESAPYTDDILAVAADVLKKGGQIKIKTPKPAYISDFDRIAKQFGLEIKNKRLFTEKNLESGELVDFEEIIFIKK